MSFKPGEFWPAFRSGYLDARGDEGEMLVGISLPNIPFHQISPDSLRNFFQNNDALAANIVGAIRSRVFAEALGSVNGDIKMDAALIFSPHTSGRQLERCVELHPELSGIAACHPNGADISLSAVPTEQRAVVERMRGRRPCLGREPKPVGPSVTLLYCIVF